MKRFVVYLLIVSFGLSVSAPQAHSAVKPGTKCAKAGVKQSYEGKTYTCIKSGSKLVWNQGAELKPASKTVKPAKGVDYSNCLEESRYETWRLAVSQYSNVAKDFGQSYSARIDNVTNTQFGNDELTFTNKSLCKVKIQILAKLQCYGPIGSQAYSYDLQSQTGEIQVSADSTITINVGKYFSSAKYSCESKPSQFASLGMRNRLSGPPFLNFGSSVTNVTIKVEGADPVKPYKELPTSTPSSMPSSMPSSSSAIGSTGPGGGIVFYDAGSQQSWGRYLEVAPRGWYGDMKDPTIIWCNVVNEYIKAGFSIGDGKVNTDLLSAKCSYGAGVEAKKYNGGGKNDWFLPSKNELNELCKYARNQPTGNTNLICKASGTLREGFEAYYYWSSSESDSFYAWFQLFVDGKQDSYKKSYTYHVRPIRAF
jgi:hypothetical protein